MPERRIYGSAVYLVEDLGLVPLSGDPKQHAQSMRCTKILEQVEPTDEEREAMAAGRRVTAEIRAEAGNGPPRHDRDDDVGELV